MGRHLRIAGRVLLALGALLLCLSGYYLARPFGRSDRWVRRFLGWAAAAFGVRVRVEGAPLARDVLIVANHLSWLDILALGGASGAAFVSKDAVRAWPVVGWLATIGGTIYIDRASRSALRGQADALRQALASGRPAAFFPEGTTGDGRTLGPFHAALFTAAVPPLPGVRVQPVALDYGAAAREIAWPDEESAVANALRLIGRAGTLPLTIRFLPPVDAGAAADRKTLAAAARDAIAATLPQAAPLG